MKRILLVTIRNEIRAMYEAELHIIFDGFLEVRSFSFENPNSERFSDALLDGVDLILTTSNNAYSLIRNHVDTARVIAELHFTFMQDKIDYLRSLPRDTTAYVGFSFYGISLQAISLFYSLGLNNLNLIAYDPNQTPESELRFGIASIGSNIFPSGFDKVFDIGPRKITFSTIMDVATRLGLSETAFDHRVAEYCRGTALPDSILAYYYDQTSNVKVQLQAIVNCIDDAFAMIDHRGIVIKCNKQLTSLLCLRSSPLGANVDTLAAFKPVVSLLVSGTELNDELVTLAGSKKALISIRQVPDSNSMQSVSIAILKDVTRVLELESGLRRQLARRGHVAKKDLSCIRGESLAITRCKERALRMASIDKPTLIIGESGTGKELLAQGIHNASARKDFPFIAINCAALAPSLLESELFGYEDGSFTGARRGGRAGLFETAHRGTFFLDEITETSLETQAKLLRVLEEHEVMRLGGNELISVDVRIIATTNRDLRGLIAEGRFRHDLFYRLNTMMLKVPPLRDRRSDILPLARAMLDELGYEDLRLGTEIETFMLRYDWDGNVRELRNCVEYLAGMADGLNEELGLEHLPEYMLEDASVDLRPMSSTLHHPFNREPETTSSSLNISPATEALSTAKELLAALYQGAVGRRSLTAVLRNRGVAVSEYAVRGAIDILRKRGLISVNRGRAGIALTPEGLTHLAEAHR